MRRHGIQFWGNWEWKNKAMTDIVLIGNYVKNGGGGAIWGTGATRVVMANNVVDGAYDIGLDHIGVLIFINHDVPVSRAQLRPDLLILPQQQP